MTDFIPLKYIPYVHDIESNIWLTIYRFKNRFTTDEIFEAYINARVPIVGNLYQGYAETDKTIAIILKALRLKLWNCTIPNTTIVRLIHASPDRLFDELCFSDDERVIPAMHSYILAHAVKHIPQKYSAMVEFISYAPQKLVMRAFELSLKNLCE